VTNHELTPEEAARAAERYEKIDKVKRENAARAAKHAGVEKSEKQEPKKPIRIKTYRGTQEGAITLFRKDAELMAAQGYFPKSQSWVPGSYGCFSFLVALLLCFLIIGILIFIYMLIVKPDGVLTVTYELRLDSESTDLIQMEKICPQCAEHVKEAAKVCRFCGYNFPSE
jgi:hypothetical protein